MCIVLDKAGKVLRALERHAAQRPELEPGLKQPQQLARSQHGCAYWLGRSDDAG